MGLASSPQTQEAYTWNLNNPLQSMDPTGLCGAPFDGIPADGIACYNRSALNVPEDGQDALDFNATNGSPVDAGWQVAPCTKTPNGLFDCPDASGRHSVVNVMMGQHPDCFWPSVNGAVKAVGITALIYLLFRGGQAMAGGSDAVLQGAAAGAAEGAGVSGITLSGGLLSAGAASTAVFAPAVAATYDG